MKKQVWIFSLGGNEVSPGGSKDPTTGRSITPDIAHQWQRTLETCRTIAGFIEKHPDDSYILTHGNGPQVGNILLRAELARPVLHSLPLDVCGADTQGAMGYMLAQLSNELKMHGLDRLVAETVTQVVVDAQDPDFANPSKFIGSHYTAEEAALRKSKDGWVMKVYGKDAAGNEIWRRVVPSPEPLEVVEIEVVEMMLASGMIPISVGGGGIPVVDVVPEIRGAEELYACNYGMVFVRPHVPGQPPVKIHSGVEAVVDKDLATALLGQRLMERARARGDELAVSLVIFTSEDGAKLDYGKPSQTDLRHLDLARAKAIYAAHPQDFPPGSMGPKMRSVIRFVEAGGKAAYITKTKLFEQTLAGKAGTTVIA